MMFEVPDAVQEHERLPAEAVREDVGLDREGRRREHCEDVAPEALSFAICDPTSGEVTWYGSAATTFEPERPSPLFRPPSRSFP